MDTDDTRQDGTNPADDTQRLPVVAALAQWKLLATSPNYTHSEEFREAVQLLETMSDDAEAKIAARFVEGFDEVFKNNDTDLARVKAMGATCLLLEAVCAEY